MTYWLHFYLVINSYNFLSAYLISYLFFDLFIRSVLSTFVGGLIFSIYIATNLDGHCLVHFCWCVLVIFSHFLLQQFWIVLDENFDQILFCGSVRLLIWFYISGSIFQQLIQPLICWVVDLFIKHLLFALSVDLLIQIFSYQFVDL